MGHGSGQAKRDGQCSSVQGSWGWGCALLMGTRDECCDAGAGLGAAFLLLQPLLWGCCSLEGGGLGHGLPPPFTRMTLWSPPPRGRCTLWAHTVRPSLVGKGTNYERGNPAAAPTWGVPVQRRTPRSSSGVEGLGWSGRSLGCCSTPISRSAGPPPSCPPAPPWPSCTHHGTGWSWRPPC